MRAFAREVEPIRPDDLGDPALTAALADLTAAWGPAALALAGAAADCADDLDAAAAAEYVQVESLLVPVALR